MARIKLVFLLTVLFFLASFTFSQTALELATQKQLNSIRNQPSLLVPFLRQMPKGGDLHNHLSGAVYAESFLQYAAHDDLCIDFKTMALYAPPCDPARGGLSAGQAFTDPVLYRRAIDSFSMRHFIPGAESGHDHFFDTFFKFGPASRPAHLGEMLAEVRTRAAAENVLYLELIFDPTAGGASRFAMKQQSLDGGLEAARARLLSSGLSQIVRQARENLDQGEAKSKTLLRCQGPQADPGCGVVVRYIAEVLRGLSPIQVFAQMVTGFELAQADSRVVGVNLVMPEDAFVEMRDFDLHMSMLDYLHRVYPRVHITLHAGELVPGLVPPEGLRFHIRQSILRGHAERIGHGVDVTYEDDPADLLRLMALRHILVEICLTSNDVILGVRGAQHPLPAYLAHGVPVAIATDDPGVSRSDMTQEYLRAVQTYGLEYPALKNIVRDSLEHGFLSGESLWITPGHRMNPSCAGQLPSSPLTPRCEQFLSHSDRATLQWELEQKFQSFEKLQASQIQ